LTINFNSRDFENPALQKFYSGLQALALNEDEPEPVKDLLEPDYEGMKVFKPVVDKFKAAFFDGDDEDVECGNAGSKGRGRGANPRKAPAPKKVMVRKQIDIGSDDEFNQPANKRVKGADGNSQSKENRP
jgi:hypothetical protein